MKEVKRNFKTIKNRRLVMMLVVAILAITLFVLLSVNAKGPVDIFFSLITTVTAFGLISWVLWIIIDDFEEENSSVINKLPRVGKRSRSPNRGNWKGKEIKHGDKNTYHPTGSLSKSMFVRDDDEPIHGRPDDTCRFCGRDLPINSLDCPDCGKKRAICPICKLNIDRDDEAAICPICHNECHLPHLRETIKITGRCPVCRKKIKRYEILIRNRI
ncbi:MAG: hypothetical protein ACXAEU_18460 [Candidatus Hodarchaeales archaeon]|jgi:hypothetical protein